MDKSEIDAARKTAAEARERAEKATDGPWKAELIYKTIHIGGGVPLKQVCWRVQQGDQYCAPTIVVEFPSISPDITGNDPICQDDAALIAAARQDVPALADLVDQLATALEQAQEERAGAAELSHRLAQDASDWEGRARAAEAENQRLQGELAQAQTTTRILAHDLGVADAKANHLREQLATRAKVSDEGFKTILAAHRRARLALKQYAEPWHWDEVDGRRRLWANNEDASTIASAALAPDAGKVDASNGQGDCEAGDERS